MRLTVSGRAFELDPGESVLDGMARHGIGLPSACRAGACHACLVRALRGDPGPPSQASLKSTWQADGYFLACLARPASDLTVALAGDEVRTEAEITSVRPIGARVIKVTLRPRQPLTFRAGQHLALTRPDGTTRVYSIANTPAEAAARGIELHVRVYQGGAMSGWLAAAPPGSLVSVGEPAGGCCYLPGQPPGPLLLAGTGTGIGPLAALLRDALSQGHAGPAVIIHGAADPAGLYLGSGQPGHCQLGPGQLTPGQPGHRQLTPGQLTPGQLTPGQPTSGQTGHRQLMPGQLTPGQLTPGQLTPGQTGHRQLTPGQPAHCQPAYCPPRRRTCVLSRGEDIAGAAAEELAELGDPAAVRAYLCGGQQAVTRMRRSLFLAGMSLKHIFADAFTSAVG
jgi:ferredoxin